MSTLALEHEVSQMEDRLAQVKIRIEVEREQWKKTSRVGKHGTKWKGAAKPNRALSTPSAMTFRAETIQVPSSPVPVSALDFITNVMPLHWDALELAQYLQTCHLKNYAQVVVYEQITGKMLIDTAPGKLRHLFQDNSGPTDPNWKSFLHIVSDLHKQQKQMERSTAVFGKRQEANDTSSPPKGTLFFPLLSPRGPPLLMNSSLKGPPNAPNNRDETLRSPRSTVPHRTSTQPMVTCWTCGSRFPRPHKQQEAATKRARSELRSFCSKRCQENMEAHSDMSISPAFSGSVLIQTTPDGNTDESIPGNHLQRLRKTVKHRSFSETPTATRRDSGNMRKCQTSRTENPDAFDFLHVTAQQSKDELPRPPAQQAKPQGPRRRVTTGATIAAAGAGTPSSIRSSIPDDLSLPLVLTNTSVLADSISQGRQPRMYQLSKYKLDPVVFQAMRSTLSSTFHANPPGRRNVLVLQEFLTVKTLHHLSLTCRAWRTLVLHSPCSDAIWGSQLLRVWSKSDEFLQEIGVLLRPERPFKMLRLLTRQLSRLALENVKELLRPETWQLAAIVTESPAGASPSKVPVQLYEQITLVFARNGEIVAVRAQELIRPLGEDRLLTDILQGLRSGALSTVDCRRLRLFSTTNRLNADEWKHLPHCHAVALFVWPVNAALPESSGVWHQKLWRRMQRGLQQRLLGKDSVQQLLRGIEERCEPPHVLGLLETFLTSAIGHHKRPRELRHPHSPMRPTS